MLSVKNGDVEKLASLFERYHKQLFNYFLYGTGCREVSDDLVQDVFLRMLKYRKSYRDDGEFKVWMFSIARNCRNDYYRGRSFKFEPIEHAGQVADSAMSPEESLLLDQDVALLKKALGELSDDMREVIILSRYQGLRYREIGEIMGCSEGAVKVRVFRAIKELGSIYNRLTG